MKFVCIRKCFFKDRLFNEGETIHFDEKVSVPRHFQAIEEQPVKEVEKEELKGDEPTIENLQTELDSMGKAYDRRWGKAKLQAEIQIAKRDSQE